MKLLYIDLFCGAGGTSTGVEAAKINGTQCSKVIACVNHDKNAIASHAANHPDSLHFTEDIRTLELAGLINHANKYRLLYPGAKIVLWASLECTNFSKAKGGQSRDADSRTLAEHLFRYVEALNPDYIQIENVEEFMSWGELDNNGKPISRLRGTDYLKWVNNIKAYGYDFTFKILNCADYGAYTSRKRFFGIFGKKGLPIVFPKSTHCKGGSVDMFDTFLKWKPVREVLDLQDEGESIFTRKKPLVDATLERIYSGLIKFVAGGKEQFLSKYNSGNPMQRNTDIDNPAGTVMTNNCLSLVTSKFLSSYYGNGFNESINNPCATITTKDRHSLVSPKFIVNQYSGGGQLSDLNNPSPAILNIPKQNLVTCNRWVMNTNFNNVGSSINEPSQVITANHKWHYLVNPQYKSQGSSIDNPCFTLIARMDKAPPYIVATESGHPIIIITKDDTAPMIKIKEFMALYGIVDIKMRMLKIPELKMIMGFPKEYTLIGTQSEQKKYIGNAVEVNMARVLCEALAMRLNIIKVNQ